MFTYSDDGIAINIKQIRAMYIDRVEASQAFSKEEHNIMDLFQLKAYMGSRIVVTISEVTGIENRPKLEARMRHITNQAHRRIRA